MRLPYVAVFLLWTVASPAQMINLGGNPQPEVERMQIQNQQLQQQLQQQQALQTQQVQQQTQQMQFQHQAEDMLRNQALAPLMAPLVVPDGGLGLLSGKWWQRAALATRLGITAEQQKKMDDIYQQARLRMIDLTATLQKEQTVLEPLLIADQPDDAGIAAQIDKEGRARVELEKANVRMMLEIRRVLTPGQWAKLKPVVSGE